jgi:hypothetical protein
VTAAAEVLSTGRPQKQLRLALRLDAVATATVGALATAGSSVLDGALGVPAPVLLGLGALLVTYAVGVWLVSRTQPVTTDGAWAVITLNAAWTLGSLVAAVVADQLTPLGTAAVIMQALAVAALAELQLATLRRYLRA